MSKQIQISKTLSLPMELMALASAALGVRGSGKTNTGVCIVEDLLEANQQVIIVDPLDVWYGIKSSADGKEEGYPVTVIGGNHGDVPLNEGDGKLIADFLTDNQVPAILSMRHLSGSAQRRMMTDFAEHLFHRKGEAAKNTPVFIVVDEASQFVPQFIRGEDARLVGAIQKWVRLGRSSGIGVMLIDQRAASVNKEVLSQIELLIAHRLTSPQDRKALKEWVDGHDVDDHAKEFFDTVAALGRGEAWFWSPSFLDVFERVQVRARHTFDSSATPKLGKAIAAPAKVAKVELNKLREQLAATIEKAKQDDPKELKRQIAELKRSLDAKPAAKVEQKTVEKLIVSDKQIAGLERARARSEKRFEKAESLIVEMRQISTEEQKAIMAITSAIAAAKHQPLPSAPPRPSTVSRVAATNSPTPRPTLRAASGSGEAIPKGERAVLIAAAQHPDGVDRTQLTVLTGYKRSSRDAYIQRLREKSYLEQRGELLLATQAGVDALGDDYEPLPVGDSLRAHWMQPGRLPEGERKVMEIIIAAYPGSVPRDTISESSGYQRSSRDAYIQRLSAKKLVEAVGRGEVKASDTLFG